MKRLYYASLTYMVLGLLAGLYYRELTKAQEFSGDTQLSVVHTHLLALGMLFFLIVLVLEKVFTLSESKWFTPFFWTYNAGLMLTVGMLVTHETIIVVGANAGAAIAGIAGLGHVGLTVGLAFLFASLYSAVLGRKKPTAGSSANLATAAGVESG